MKNKEILKETELIKSIMKANHELTVANKNFEGAEDDLIDYYSSSPKLDRHELIDKTVRSYGSYLALYDEFDQEVTLHPKHYYFNGQFLKLYKFLENKKTFEDFIVRFDDFKGLLLEI